MRDEIFDVLIIGGGATGLGVAVDSASRGYSTALVEAADFASGTSSRSTKLVHGGVRYLAQGNVGLVREALRERGLLLQNAPHLAHELRFLVPTYNWWELGYYGAGLKCYDLLAGSLGLRPAHILGAAAASVMIPTIRQKNLKGGVVYSDAQFNDTRLAMSLARTATGLGAALANYARVHSLLKTNGKVSGAVVTDSIAGAELLVRARCVVNATGVFVDSIRRMDDPDAGEMITASQGIHIVLDRSFLPGDAALMVPKTDDGRVLFAIPWQNRILVGTTDTPVAGPTDEPVAMSKEIEFVLDHTGRYLNQRPGPDDVLSVFAGLRPLVRRSGPKSTAALSRDHTLLLSDAGLVTITGGKWTTYRKMAEDAMRAVVRVAGLDSQPCVTAGLRLHGSGGETAHWMEFGATPAEAAYYEQKYPGELHPRLPYSLAQAVYVIDHEMPERLEDLLSRRLRALLLDARAAAEAAPLAAELMAARTGRDEAWVAEEVDGFRRLASRYVLPGSHWREPVSGRR
jgi:glycerol-3-phosphate dehydrogenase